MATILLVEALVRLNHLRYDYLWLVNILQNACLYKRWGSHSSDPEFGRIDTEWSRGSWMSSRGFPNKLRTFEKLLVGEKSVTTYRGVTSSDNWQHTVLVSHYDLFAFWHTAQRSPLFQSALSRGSRVECIAVNIGVLLTMFKGGAGDVLLWLASHI